MKCPIGTSDLRICGGWRIGTDAGCVLVSTGRKDGLTLLEPQSRFGDKPLKSQVVCPQNGTAVLKGLMGKTHTYTCCTHTQHSRSPYARIGMIHATSLVVVAICSAVADIPGCTGGYTGGMVMAHTSWRTPKTYHELRNANLDPFKANRGLVLGTNHSNSKYFVPKRRLRPWKRLRWT